MLLFNKNESFPNPYLDIIGIQYSFTYLFLLKVSNNITMSNRQT